MESAQKEQSFRSRLPPTLQIISPDNVKALLEIKDNPNRTARLIGTHSEVFHCDEVVATTMLQYTKEFRDSIIIRTRNQEILDQLDIVCDVGGTYDPSKYRFDHHQRSFNTAWYDDEKKDDESGSESKQSNNRIKLSSAGLVYKFFGKEFVKTVIDENWGTSYTEADIDKIYQRLYSGIIQEVDAIDNGVTIAKDCRYKICTNLGDRISRFNKAWNAPSHINQNEQFRKAMKVAEEELIWQIYSQSQVFLPARQIVQKAWEAKNTFHSSGELLYLPTPCPWKDHIFEIEGENGQDNLLKFVFYQDERKMYRVQGIPLKNNYFEQRVNLCKAWRGLRNEELKNLPGLEDMEFVHHAGFIGGAWSLKTALKMAELSLQEKNNPPEEIDQQQS